MKMLLSRQLKLLFTIIFLLITSYNTYAKHIDGLIYKNISTANKQFIHLLYLDPNKINIQVALNNSNSNIKLANLIDLAKQSGAIAGVNGSFFHANGQAAGILKTNDRFYGIAYLPRAAIGWNKQDNRTLIDRLQTKTNLVINNHVFPVHAMNRPLSNNRAILSTNIFNGFVSNAPHLIEQTTHIIIVDDKVTAVIANTYPTKLPNNCYIYSINNSLLARLPAIQAGDHVTINITVSPQLSPKTAATWKKMDFIVGGAPLLIYDHNLITNFNIEKVSQDFIYSHYARTAIGILPDETWVVAVVEDNNLANIQGMTLPELAQFMHSLGIRYALNLDGGGSSNMFLKGKIISASNESEPDNFNLPILRPISNAILFNRK